MKTYRPDFDGLRAIAVLSVLLFHCGVPGFSGGYVGVDVFFVISGALITGHLAAEMATGTLSIRRFYEKRIRRIVPALFAMLVSTWLAAAWLQLPSFLLGTSRALMAAAASVSNVYFWKSANYFAADSGLQPLLHTWSLSVEEQFYLVIPVLMLVTARWVRGRWFLLFGPICALSLALSIIATTTAPTANFYLLPTRMWELALGSLVVTAPLPRLGRLGIECAGIGGLASVLAPVFLFDDATAFPGFNALYPCLGSALLILVGSQGRCVATRWLSLRPMVAVGLISYSLYLVHWPIVALVRYRAAGVLHAREIIGILFASIVLATLSWRFVEQPFRRPNPVLTQRRVLMGGCTALACAALLGWIGVRAEGFPSRFPDFVEQTIPGHALWKQGRCFLTGDPDYRRWSATDCTRIATGPHRVLLWGDSFAGHYVPGILAHAEALHATILQYTAAGCPPVLSYRSYARVMCAEWNAHALEIVRSEQIDTVILAGRWTDMRQRGLGEISSTLAALDRLGVRTILIGQSPEFAIDVQALGFLKGSTASAPVNRAEVVFSGEVNEQLRTIAGTHRFIDPMPALCDGGVCTFRKDGNYFFEDYGHLSATGSAVVVKSLLLALGGWWS